MKRLLLSIQSGIIATAITCLATTAYGATLAYEPASLDLEMNPGQERSISTTVTLTTRVRGSQMLWFLSEITDGNLPQDWVSVSPGTAFVSNSSPSATTMLSIQVPEGTPSGMYSGFLKSSGMGAHSGLDPGPGLPITVQVGQNCSNVPEIVISGLTPEIIWPPNNKMDAVTVTGTIQLEDGCTLMDLFYSLQDEYGVLTGTGTISLDPGNTFTASVPVEASRKGKDKDGRHYTIMVFARNEAGTGTSMNLQAVVPHDMRKK